MFQVKSGIYIHNIFKPNAKQSELDYNTGTIISERDDAQKNSLKFLILWQVGMSLVFIIRTSKFIWKVFECIYLMLFIE